MAAKDSVATLFPAGHYFSPVVNPTTVRDYYARELKRKPDELGGIAIDLQSFRELWLSFQNLSNPRFNEEPVGDPRYYVNNGNYGFSDAAVLRGMIGTLRPKRIIEIGSGNSTACMLDALDEFGIKDCHIVCVEPYPHRLKAILKPDDSERVTLIQEPVQNAPISIFENLKPNDILFVDSTHVVKTGSDVHFEFFYILPRLEKGVFVHFHDCAYPFEYPPKWVLEENRSWNEVYVLRAFLMYNSVFEIIFWTTLFVDCFRELCQETLPRMLANPKGSGIWLRKTT